MFDTAEYIEEFVFDYFILKLQAAYNVPKNEPIALFVLLILLLTLEYAI